MSLDAFEQALQHLSPEQLQQAKALLEKKAQLDQAAPGPDEPQGADRRTEPRFGVNVAGTARPLESARGSGEKSFPITIIDLSRKGLRFMVDATMPLFPLAEVSFVGPSGRIRSVYVKMVRTRIIAADPPHTNRRRYEVAARALSEKELAQAQQRQRAIQAAGKKAQSKEGLPVILVGESDEAGDFETQLKIQNFQVIRAGEITQLTQTLTDGAPQVVVYLEGQQAVANPVVLRSIQSDRPHVAQLAIVRSAEERRALHGLGVDECLHAINADSLLSLYVERALKIRLANVSPETSMGSTRVLMAVDENLSLAHLGMGAHSDVFQVVFSYDLDGTMGLLRCGEIDAVVLDVDVARRDQWSLLKSISREFVGLPVIVAVTELTQGPKALASGATEYLALPSGKAELMTMVASARRVAEYEAALALTV